MSKLLLTISLILLMPSIAFAKTDTTKRNITRIDVQSNGSILFYGNWSTVEGCTYSTVILEAEPDVFKSRVLSAALAAQMGGKKVFWYISGCNGNQMTPITLYVVSD